jgi:hypothetical protein
MKKQLVIIGIIAILVCVGLSGCNEQKSTENPYSNDIQISNMKVVTRVIGDSYPSYDEVLSTNDEFYHGHEHDNPTTIQYVVSGTIKNIGSKIIDKVVITVKFYNDKGNFLYGEDTYVTSLYMGDTESFTVILFENSARDYFNNVTDYKLEITSVDSH